MTMLPGAVRRYLDKRGVHGSWTLHGAERRDFYGAVVIPALAEGDSLFRTLQSLLENPPGLLERFLVVVVVNQGADAERQLYRQNQADLDGLKALAVGAVASLAWVDASGPGLEVPGKRAGVGFARKLGLDLALSYLDWGQDPVLVCLDADTLVETSYLQAIDGHFRTAKSGAAVLPFRHQPVDDPAQQAAIVRYELFLRSYVFGLRLAGSPYAFNTVGSAMACRASAYVRCGGMNTRKAGEDFYFLQKLAKTDGVSVLSGTTIYPAARVSGRVPFGTGRSMERLLAGDSQGVLFYPVEVFKILSKWLKLVAKGCTLDAESLLARAEAISPIFSDYLVRADWLNAWPALQKTYPEEVRLGKAFHVWFDGFKTLRLIHHLCEESCQRGEPEELLPAYFAWQGQTCPDSREAFLDRLRQQDDC